MFGALLGSLHRVNAKDLKHTDTERIGQQNSTGKRSEYGTKK